MARPATTADVKDRTISAGTVDIAAFATAPTVLKTWAAFAESVTKAGGEVRPGQYRRHEVEIWVQRDEAQLREQLRQEQYQWDDYQKVYDICAINHTPPENWQKEAVKAWAVAEGLPVVWEIERSRPEDEELRRLREQLSGK